MAACSALNFHVCRLLKTCLHGTVRATQALVETGASAPPKPEFSHLADSVDADGLTALHVAAGAGHAGVVAALMQHTPEALAKVRRGWDRLCVRMCRSRCPQPCTLHRSPICGAMA
eukprot:354857-Chlamydomonas_euryale.AAC.51